MGPGQIRPLFEVLLKIQGSVAKVERDGSNSHTKSRYPTLEAVLDVLNPQLQEHQVLLYQYTLLTEGQWVLRTTLVLGDDQQSYDLPLLGLEQASNRMQAIGSAMTYARRYQLMAIFKLAPTDDDAESLTVVPEKKPPEKRAPTNHAPPAKDMKIPDGRFRGKMASSIPREDLKAYIEENLRAMETSGHKPPQWFEDLRKVSGL